MTGDAHVEPPGWRSIAYTSTHAKADTPPHGHTRTHTHTDTQARLPGRLLLAFGWLCFYYRLRAGWPRKRGGGGVDRGEGCRRCTITRTHTHTHTRTRTGTDTDTRTCRAEGGGGSQDTWKRKSRCSDRGRREGGSRLPRELSHSCPPPPNQSPNRYGDCDSERRVKLGYSANAVFSRSS